MKAYIDTVKDLKKKREIHNEGLFERRRVLSDAFKSITEEEMVRWHFPDPSSLEASPLGKALNSAGLSVTLHLSSFSLDQSNEKLSRIMLLAEEYHTYNDGADVLISPEDFPFQYREYGRAKGKTLHLLPPKSKNGASLTPIFSILVHKFQEGLKNIGIDIEVIKNASGDDAYQVQVHPYKKETK